METFSLDFVPYKIDFKPSLVLAAAAANRPLPEMRDVVTTVERDAVVAAYRRFGVVAGNTFKGATIKIAGGGELNLLWISARVGFHLFADDVALSPGLLELVLDMARVGNMFIHPIEVKVGLLENVSIVPSLDRVREVPRGLPAPVVCETAERLKAVLEALYELQPRTRGRSAIA